MSQLCSSVQYAYHFRNSLDTYYVVDRMWNRFHSSPFALLDIRGKKWTVLLVAQKKMKIILLSSSSYIWKYVYLRHRIARLACIYIFYQESEGAVKSSGDRSTVRETRRISSRVTVDLFICEMIYYKRVLWRTFVPHCLKVHVRLSSMALIFWELGTINGRKIFSFLRVLFFSAARILQSNGKWITQLRKQLRKSLLLVFRFRFLLVSVACLLFFPSG